MYIPEHFREDDRGTLHDLIERYSFATLISQHEGAPNATHLPVLIQRNRGEYGTLLAHIAKANPQRQALEDRQELLIIFQGPHAYVSPSWYAPGPANVPTWNYAAVHAYGQARVLAGAGALDVVRSLTEANEARFEKPWELNGDSPAMRKMLDNIIAFEIEITRLEGKFKLSQNRPVADRLSVAIQLADSSDETESELAKWMRARIKT